PLIIPNAAELRRRYPTLAESVGDGGPAVVVPLMYEDRAIGGMYFRYTEPNAIAEEDRSFLSALGRQCASALERARLNARLAARLRGQEAVARLGQLALLHSELGPLFAAAAKELADVLDAD